MDLGLKGKKAIVCAASKGLGRACAMSLAREGGAPSLSSGAWKPSVLLRGPSIPSIDESPKSTSLRTPLVGSKTTFLGFTSR